MTDQLEDFVRRAQAAQHAVDQILQTSDRFFVVWSFEHQAWWGPGRIGYTLNLHAAGRYSEAEADEIVDKANRYAKQLMECKMPVPRELTTA